MGSPQHNRDITTLGFHLESMDSSLSFSTAARALENDLSALAATLQPAIGILDVSLERAGLNEDGRGLVGSEAASTPRTASPFSMNPRRPPAPAGPVTSTLSLRMVQRQ